MTFATFVDTARHVAQSQNRNEKREASSLPNAFFSFFKGSLFFIPVMVLKRAGIQCNWALIE